MSFDTLPFAKQWMAKRSIDSFIDGVNHHGAADRVNFLIIFNISFVPRVLLDLRILQEPCLAEQQHESCLTRMLLYLQEGDQTVSSWQGPETSRNGKATQLTTASVRPLAGLDTPHSLNGLTFPKVEI